ncbi:DUF2255 family protein [Lactiplantibacillus plantarum]|nr:DUF2255 family protein [Lactiplantibacillus plantarum]QXN30430.1 DUF2255 family protein [Lactiplantibacillus plantarum subsp. plantarum]QXN33396.1 DUF2255 family protein [Lactiplantibacillus plantarum subsp. plantarum]
MSSHGIVPHWQPQQLTDFSSADDFRVSPFYSDGKTYGTPTWIWSVVVDNHLYVRAWNGLNSRWHRSAVKQRAGRMYLAGANYEISFADVDNANLNDKIDRAYQEKYVGSPYLDSMIQKRSKASTLEIVPR